MAYVTGMMLIDAPASALNNAGAEEGARTDNTIAVKKIRTREGDYPYVSAQAVRFWLRTLLERNGDGWKAAPIQREAKIAYTDGNPIRWWDDDLFGYMRAESKKAGAKGEKTESELTPTSTEITRISPLRVSTFVSVAPVTIVDDFGTMARHSGDPVPHEHQFYRATLQGLFSLNLTTAGTFFAGGPVGYRNLDDNRIKQAQKMGLDELALFGQKAYRLPFEERAKRAAAVIKALGELEGGAKLSLHYTDVTPPWIVAAVTRSGNHPFFRVVRQGSRRQPEVVVEALREILRVYRDQFLSDVYFGWARGYMDEYREAVEGLSDEDRSGVRFQWGHPREVTQFLAKELTLPDNVNWYE
jgi:CRISPR-associated protein Cst2